MKRRSFLGAAAAGAGLSIPRPVLAQTAASRGRIVGANDRVRVGQIGCGGMGTSDLKDFLRVADTECVALCDVDQSQSAKVLRTVVEPLSQKPSLVTQDFRRVLDLKDIDAVIVSTPDHWHALCTVMACQAGKDVYVEKPLSLTIDEGRMMVNAARKYDRIVQMGNQRRSSPAYLEIADYIQSGKLGKIRFVRSWCYLDWIGEIPVVPDSEAPSSVDYDMWLGPAPKRPFNQNRFHFTFRWYWDYANGLLTDWGAHLIDVCIWIMGVKAPLSAVAMGGKLGYPDDSMETPDTMHVMWQYPGFNMIWEHAIGMGRGPEASEHGIEVHGNDAVLLIGPTGWRVVAETERPKGKPRKERGQALAQQNMKQGDIHFQHHQNFVDCIRSRQRPRSDVETGHNSMLACHLGNISYRLGRSVTWDAQAEIISGDPEAQKYLTRGYRAPWKLSL